MGGLQAAFSRLSWGDKEVCKVNILCIVHTLGSIINEMFSLLYMVQCDCIGTISTGNLQILL